MCDFLTYSKLGAFFFLVALFSACAQPVQVERFTSTPAKAPGCKVDVYSVGQVVGGSIKVGKIKISDNGLNFRCHLWSSVEEAMKEEACKVGADAIQILEVRSPDNESYCYRATAYFLEYRDDRLR